MGPKYLNHHVLLPRMYVGRKVELQTELGLDPSTPDMGVGVPPVIPTITPNTSSHCEQCIHNWTTASFIFG